MHLKKLFYKTVAITVLIFLALVAYGLKTDCPDTAGYVYCAKED